MSTPSVDPNLSGRRARCAYYGGRKARGSYSSSSCKNGRDAVTCTCEEPSSNDLAFFEFCGDGSREASICAVCGMHSVAHQDGLCPNGLKRHQHGTRYTPQGGQAFDKFYCGCHGWE